MTLTGGSGCHGQEQALLLVIRDQRFGEEVRMACSGTTIVRESGFFGIENTALRKRYLEGLRKCKKQGIRVLIDGEEASEKRWYSLFGVADDGGFYMADFVTEPEGQVREIRFDRVHVKELYTRRK